MNVPTLVTLAAALADGTRLQVLELANGRSCITEIARRLNITTPTTRYHLGVLERAGLVTVERRGRRHLARRIADVGRLLVRALG
jgi:DNA-binding transcriptional ArsR family regulator